MFGMWRQERCTTGENWRFGAPESASIPPFTAMADHHSLSVPLRTPPPTPFPFPAAFRYEKHMDSVTSCAWLPDSERFVSGSIDKYIYMWHLDGRCIRHWKGSRINDLAISRSGKWMVSTSNEKKFHLYDLVKDTEIAVQEQESIISLCLSKHSDMLLVNLQNQKIHLWDLNDFFASNGAISLPTEPVRRYRGQHEKQGRYVIRSCFGGSNETFVVSGSEDSQVYIWHQQKGDLLKVLSGHSGTVNAVTWNPADPYTFASASDDHSIRIWGRE